MSGMNPCTWTTLDAYARMTETVLYPHEARAVMTCDAIMCFPGDPKDDE